jgi:hypothetical protein
MGAGRGQARHTPPHPRNPLEKSQMKNEENVLNINSKSERNLLNYSCNVKTLRQNRI